MLQTAEMVKHAMHKLYIGRCTVKCAEKSLKANKSTQITWLTKYECVPCRLSFESRQAVYEKGLGFEADKQAVVFLDRCLEIPPGSRLIITQNCRTDTYTISGKISLYPSHQEIPVELLKEMA